MEPGHSPDESRDVIVHFAVVTDAQTGQREATWNLFIGGALHDTLLDESAAINTALDRAAEVSRPAWLHDADGYPLKPLTEDDRRIYFSAPCQGNAAHRPTFLFRAADLRRELESGTVRLHCVTCDHLWPANAEERDGLRRTLGRANAR